MASSGTTAGIGIDVQTLVSQLMTIERQPIDKLNTKVTTFQNKVSSFGTLKGLVSGLQSSVQSLQDSLGGLRATPADSSVLSASADSTAAAGNYNVAVTKLAKAQNLVASGVASDTTALSTGASTVTLSIGGSDTDVTVGAGATLRNIRDAINNAGLGVTATIVNDGSATPYRLTITANETGTSHAITSITVKSGGDSAINSLLAYNPTTNPPVSVTMSQTVAAQNASFTVNGIANTSSSNTISGAIQGVTLTLKSESATTVSVERDTSSITSAASNFVSSYNALATQLKSRSAYGTATSAAGVLAGDGTVRRMLEQMRSILSTPATGGSLSYLAEIGITSNVDGTLNLNNSKLTDALNSSYSDVVNLLSSSSGVATRFADWATTVTEPGGLIDARTNTINDSITDYNKQISRLESRMTALQKQYTTTYTNLNIMLLSMNQTSSYLTSQFG